jgi:type II secretory pathway pseudopilin PulG
VPFCAYCGSQVAETSYRPCPSCANPTNGAPAARLGTGGKNSLVIVVVVIILAVLAIPMLGIFSAIAIPHLLTAMQRSKQKRTMADIRTMAGQADAYFATHGRYPETVGVIKVDGWNHPFRYSCINEAEKPCAGYAIVSAGKDGRFEHDSAAGYTAGKTSNFDADIAWVNGAFLQYPEGAQR